MGFIKTFVATALFVSHVYCSSVQCQTAYASTQKLLVPTRTTTTTALSTWTTTVYNSTTTTTRSITNTYISLKGSVTKTVPTGPLFTPIISAPSSTSSSGRKRTPEPPIIARATTKYPQSVDCTATITRSVEVSATSTLTIILTTYPAKVVTSLVPTQTVYAACTCGDNALTNFNDKTINDNLQGNVIDYPCGSYYDGFMSPEYGINTTYQGIACHSQVQCCEVAQTSNYSGYGYFVQNGGHICLWTQGSYDFTSVNLPGYIIPGDYGNGPQGSGTYLTFAN